MGGGNEIWVCAGCWGQHREVPGLRGGDKEGTALPCRIPSNPAGAVHPQLASSLGLEHNEQ